LSKVFVLDTNKRPLNMVHPGRARKLLSSSQAAIFKRYPFTIILKKEVGGPINLLRIKIDPGSRFTGLALVENKEVVFAAEIEHRGHRVKKLLDSKRVNRKNRRRRKTRYRQARFLNRRKPKGWIPPSLESRVQNIKTWVSRLSRLALIDSISLELVKFDLQKLQNPEISGVEYQQGELFGYEVREYLLEKWGRKCVYCGCIDKPLQIEHIIPKSRGGSNRISNLTLACEKCNQKKGNLTAEEFGFPDIQKQTKKSLRDATIVNVTRWRLFNLLKKFNLPLEIGSGGKTKFNRTNQNYPKTHWIDAACVGKSGEEIKMPSWIKPLHIKAFGHGSRQKCRTDKYGFPKSYVSKEKYFMGYQTGDIVKANILKGKYKGYYIGRIAIRHQPKFSLNGFNVHPKYLKIIQHNDGYGYGIFAFLLKRMNND